MPDTSLPRIRQGKALINDASAFLPSHLFIIPLLADRAIEKEHTYNFTRGGKSMRKLGKLTRFILVAVLVACLMPIAAFGADKPDEFPNAIGEVVYLSGTVKAEQPDGTTRILDLSKQVIPKDVIVTGTKSSVEILFKDESVFSQGSQARISLDEFVYSGEATGAKLLFQLGEGTFRYVTGQIVKQNPDGFEIRTPTTTVGIRGTEAFAKVNATSERVGNLELSKGHTMTVGKQKITKALTAVNVNRATGDVSAPDPVSPEEAKEIIKAAPQTTQGELGAKNDDPADMKRKADAFSEHLNRTKDGLGTGKPDYGDLRDICLQEYGAKNADRDSRAAQQASSEGGGGGG